MRLDQLEWVSYGAEAQAHAYVSLSERRKLDIWHRVDGTYSLYLDRPDRTMQDHWFGVDAVAAQAILYHLLSGVTDEREDTVRDQPADHELLPEGA